MHDQPVDPLAEEAGRVHLGEGAEAVAAHISITGRGDAERGQVLPGQVDEPGALGRAHPGDVVPEVAFEEREHRPLVNHAVEAALAVAAERATGRVRLAVLEPGFPQRGRVEHTDVQ